MKKKNYFNPKLNQKVGKFVTNFGEIKFPRPSLDEENLLSECLKETYQDLRTNGHNVQDSLKELHIASFENDQIWSQIESYQSPLLEILKEEIKTCEKESVDLVKQRVKLMYQDQPDDEIVPPPPMTFNIDPSKEVSNEGNEIVPPPPLPSSDSTPNEDDDTPGKKKSMVAEEEEDFFEGDEDQFDDKDESVENVDKLLERMEKDLEEVGSLENSTHYNEIYDFNMDGSEDDEDEDDDEEEGEEEEEETKTRLPKTMIEKQQENLLNEIEKFEKDRMDETRWQDRGEVSQFDRPNEGLLEEDLTFVTQTKLKPVVFSEKKTEDLESIILNRILDKNFDDPEPAPSISDLTRRQKEQEELKKVKERRGLGQIYEEEYRKHVIGEEEEEGDLDDGEDGENPALNKEIIKNISKHMERVMHTMNSMSSYNYIQPTKVVDDEEGEDEAEDEKEKVRDGQEKDELLKPTIMMEEKTPNIHSSPDSMMNLPRDIMKPIRSLAVGETEKTRKDRKRKRRHKKQKFKKKKTKGRKHKKRKLN